LDTLDPLKFKTLTQRDSFNQVWQNILLFLQNDFSVKINVVVMKNINDNEVIEFIKLTENLPLHVRFIEYMPFDQNGWEKEKVKLTSEMLSEVQETFEILKLKDEKHDTAKKYSVLGYKGTFAFITTMSQPFCEECNRLRITADGKMKNCLFGKDELDLLSAFRNNECIEPIIEKALFLKHQTMGGQFEQTYLETNPSLLQNRSMLKIGG
jgi:cyclic pyranopterin phosphate synthase